MSAESRPRSVLELTAMKAAGRRIVMLTCYDALFARLLDGPDVDVLLVGDSVNQVLAGPGIDAQRHARPDDLPRGVGPARRRARCSSWTCRSSPTRSPPRTRSGTRAASCRRPARTASSSRAGVPWRRRCRALVERGIPVMGHLGLTPQSVHTLGGYRVQGREDAARASGCSRTRARSRRRAPSPWCSSCCPRRCRARDHRGDCAIPTIGIGAGARLRRPGAGAARHARAQRRLHAEVPQALRGARGRGPAGGGGIRGRRARRSLSRPGAQLRVTRSGER